MQLVSLNENACLSFSQFGEDLFLDAAFFQNQLEGFYVDIGCHHPYRLSNTCIFYMRGWRGLNVDVDPQAIALFERERPDDINVLSGVGKSEGQATAYLFNDGAVNTLSPELAREYEKIDGRKIVSERIVDVRPLDRILADHVPAGVEIDFMSIDVEGLDFEVLSSNDWDRFRPRALVVKAQGVTLHNFADVELTKFLSSKGYRLEGILHISAVFRRM